MYNQSDGKSANTDADAHSRTLALIHAGCNASIYQHAYACTSYSCTNAGRHKYIFKHTYSTN